MLRHERIGDRAVFAEGAGGADLIEPHEPRVARHVSRDYGREPASDPGWCCSTLIQAFRLGEAFISLREPLSPAYGDRFRLPDTRSVAET